jgi:hypothetical protein
MILVAFESFCQHDLIVFKILMKLCPLIEQCELESIFFGSGDNATINVLIEIIMRIPPVDEERIDTCCFCQSHMPISNFRICTVIKPYKGPKGAIRFWFTRLLRLFRQSVGAARWICPVKERSFGVLTIMIPAIVVCQQ